MDSFEGYSVAIANWGARNHVLRLLKSLQGENVDAVFIIDCSRELSIDDLRDLSSAHLHPVPNLGYAGANNLAARLALRAGYAEMVVLNPDVVPNRGAVDRLVRTLRGSPTETFAVGALSEHAGSDFSRPHTEGIRYFDWRRGEVLPPAASPRSDVTAYPNGAALALRLAPFLQIGGFDSRLFLYFEELDLICRARQRGLTFCIDAAALFSHEGSVSTAKAPRARAYFIARNRVILRRRYSPISARASRDAAWVLHAVASKLTRGRYAEAAAYMAGWKDGWLCPLSPTPDPWLACREQRYETVDPEGIALEP